MSPVAASDSSASAADTRQRLLQSAAEVFAAEGFHQATVRQITDQAGVNLAAVNYHFRDKAELYAEVMRDCFCANATSPALDPSLPAEEQLHAWIRRFVEEKYGQSGPSWKHQLMAREMQEPTPALGALVEERILPQARELERIVQQLHPAPLTRDELYLMGFSIVSQILFYLSHAAMAVRIHPPFGEKMPDPATLTSHVFRFSLAALQNYSSLPQEEKKVLPGPQRRTGKSPP